MRWAALVDFALDIAVAYRKTQQPRKPRIAADAVLLSLSALLLLVGIGFGLAAAYGALLVLGSAAAAGLTAAIAVFASLLAFALSRLVMSRR